MKAIRSVSRLVTGSSVPLALLVALCVTCLAPQSAQAAHPWEKGVWGAAPMDWPYWRGPEMNGISREKGIVAQWTQNRGGRKGQNVLWFNEELAGRSTPIVMNGKLYVIVRDQPGTPQEGEKVVCVDAATGKKLWENRWNVFLSDVPDTRVGWSSVVGDPHTGDVFALGVCDMFRCIDGETGKTKWEHSLSEEYGFLNTYGGRTNFPIIHGDLVIISGIVIGWGEMAKPAHRFVAFDKRNGQAVWFEGTRLFPFDTTYSAPSITVIDGESQLIFASGDGDLHGFQPQTGQSIWNYRVSPKRGVNTAPLVVGNMVFCGHSEENVGENTMGALFAVDASKDGLLTKENGGELWRHNQWFVGKAAPLHWNGYLYAIDNGGTLRVVEAKTGKLVQSMKLGGPGFASPLYADNKIFVATSNGRWWTFEPQDDGKLKVLYRSRLRGTEVYGSPIVSHGRLYIPTTTGMYCVGTQDGEPAADPRPEFPKEAPVKADQKPAHVQVVPVESLLIPGQHQPLHVRLFNSKGQLLRTVDSSEVTFSLDGRGSINPEGIYQSEKGSGFAAVDVTAEVDGLKGHARIRVVPELPWNVDFDDGNIPEPWVGLRYRHIPLDFDLYTKLKDEQGNLPAARLYIYLQTGFVNGLPGSPPGALVYNQKSPRRTLDGLLRYMQLDAKVSELKQAQAALDPLLKVLTAEKFIAGHEWSQSSETGIQLVVKKGSRGITGNGVMIKIATIPKGQASQGWMGHTHFSNYTIQADVQGTQRKTARGVKLPDIAITAQRYTLALKGPQQELEIRSWHAQLRMAEQVPFQWKAGVWYTLKLQASVEDGKAVLRGKCWQRDKPEPKEWTIVAEDSTPNLRGSPGLYGDALHTELFYDNLKVYPNPSAEK